MFYEKKQRVSLKKEKNSMLKKAENITQTDQNSLKMRD